jgi:hypothetical protein
LQLQLSGSECKQIQQRGEIKQLQRTKQPTAADLDKQQQQQPSAQQQQESLTELQQFLQTTVLPLVDAHIEQYDARGMANTLWALGTLRQQQQQQQQQQPSSLVGGPVVAAAAVPSRDWVTLWCSRSLPLLQLFDAQQLANSLWGLAQLQHRPGDSWVLAWYDSMATQCAAAAAAAAADCTVAGTAAAAAGLRAQALSSAVWSLVQLINSNNISIRPSTAWQQSLLAAAAVQLRSACTTSSTTTTSSSSSSPRGDVSSSSALSGQFLSNLLWSWTQLECQLSTELLSAALAWLQHTVAAAPHQLSNQAVANMLWSLAKLHQQQQQQASQQDDVQSLLHHPAEDPDEARRQSGQTCSSSSSSSSTPLRHHRPAPPGSSTAAGPAPSRGRASRTRSSRLLIMQRCGELLLDLTGSRLTLTGSSQMNMGHIASVVWAAGVLQLGMSSSWVTSLLRRLQHQTQQQLTQPLPDQQLSSMLWVLGQLKARGSLPGSAEVDDCQMTAAEVDEVVEQLLQAQQGQLQGCSGQSLSSSLLSVAVMGHRPDDQLLQSWLAEMSRRHFLSAEGGAAMVDSCCALALLNRLKRHSSSSSSSSSSRNSCVDSWRLSRSRNPGGSSSGGRSVPSNINISSFEASWLTGFCAASSSRLASFTGQQLSAVGWAVASLGVKPATTWVLAWQTAVASKASSMPAAAVARAIQALLLLPVSGNNSRTCCLSALADAAVAAASSGVCDARTLAVAASGLAAVDKRDKAMSRGQGGSSSSDRSGHVQQAGAAVQQLLKALPAVLYSCNAQELVLILTAAAEAGAVPSGPLLEGMMQHSQRLGSRQQLDSRTAAVMLVTTARLTARARSSRPQQQQQLPSEARVKTWLNNMLQHCRLESATVAELSMTLWAHALLQQHPTRSWLQSWLQYSRDKLTSFSTQQLATTGWSLAVLKVRLDSSWSISWLQAVQQQAVVAAPRHMAAMLYATAALRCQPDWQWLLACGSTAAAGVGHWRAEDHALGLWGLGQLGFWVVANQELLEVLHGHMMAVTAAGAGMQSLQQLSPNKQLQLLQAAVLLSHPARFITFGRCGTSWKLQQRTKLTRTTIRRLRWAVKKSAVRVVVEAAAAATAVAAFKAQQQQQLQQQPQAPAGLGSNPSSSSSSSYSHTPSKAQAAEAVALLNAAVVDAADAAAALSAVTHGRRPDAVGLPLDPSWVLLWCQGMAQQISRWSPELVAAALAAFAAAGVQPPLAWQQHVLSHILQGRRWTGKRAALQAQAIDDALTILQSPLRLMWRKRFKMVYRANMPGQRSQHAAAAESATSPEQFVGSRLLDLKKQQQTRRLVYWWQQQQQQRRQLQQQRQLQKNDWRQSAAAGPSARLLQGSWHHQQQQQQQVVGNGRWPTATSSIRSGAAVSSSTSLPWPAAGDGGSGQMNAGSSSSSSNNSSSNSSQALEGRRLSSSWLRLAQRPVRPNNPSSTAASSSQDDAEGGDGNSNVVSNSSAFSQGTADAIGSTGRCSSTDVSFTTDPDLAGTVAASTGAATEPRTTAVNGGSSTTSPASAAAVEAGPTFQRTASRHLNGEQHADVVTVGGDAAVVEAVWSSLSAAGKMSLAGVTGAAVSQTLNSKQRVQQQQSCLS